MLKLPYAAEVVGARRIEGGGRTAVAGSQSSIGRETRSTRCNANQPAPSQIRYRNPPPRCITTRRSLRIRIAF
ncbi:hypothetical protein HBH56_066040 [Parastagonospora nodorum]|nr:hypothetical protein HBH56_066040 [Parastagonospora nodorum]KAH3932498.1 hypothetical protein HBH54_082050 [Parastagonospora nodorum]KAH3988256.1 hypothetical protein HBH51_005520 [Parastagonospora nodorum]KAH4004999.1 hypothetical protein HBI10_044010 [Parastagonospora nodorum]KAH4030994.1 hypothetical protein HBI13_027460 [Parastagonospora nodorum]